MTPTNTGDKLMSLTREMNKEIRLAAAARPRPRKSVLVQRVREIEEEIESYRVRRSKIWSRLGDPSLPISERRDLNAEVQSLTRLLNGHEADMKHYDRKSWPSYGTGGSGLSEERRWLAANLLVATNGHPSQLR